MSIKHLIIWDNKFYLWQKISKYQLLYIRSNLRCLYMRSYYTLNWLSHYCVKVYLIKYEHHHSYLSILKHIKYIHTILKGMLMLCQLSINLIADMGLCESTTCSMPWWMISVKPQSVTTNIICSPSDQPVKCVLQQSNLDVSVWMCHRCWMSPVRPAWLWGKRPSVSRHSFNIHQLSNFQFRVDEPCSVLLKLSWMMNQNLQISCCWSNTTHCSVISVPFIIPRWDGEILTNATYHCCIEMLKMTTDGLAGK